MRPSAVPSLGWRLAGKDAVGDIQNARDTGLRATASTAHSSELFRRPGSRGCGAAQMSRDTH